MRYKDIFSDIDDDTADKLSSGYPVLDDAKKERLYAMSKRKYDIDEEPVRIREDVSGVEKSRRPKWLATAGVAAAVALVIAGIGGSTLLIGKNGKKPGAEVSVQGASVPETEYETIEATEVPETEAVADAEAIATELADAYADFFSDLYGGTMEVDKSDVVTKTVWEGEDGVKLERDFYRVTDPDYASIADIRERCCEILDEEYGGRLLDHSNFCKEEEVSEATFMFEGADGLYVQKDVHDSNCGPVEPAEPLKISEEADGTITCVMTENVKTSKDEFVRIHTLHIAPTDAGWRIVLAEEEIK